MTATGRRRFSDAEALRKFHPANFAEFLRRFPTYLERRDIELPVQPDADNMPYVKLVPLFMRPDADTPHGFAETMFLLNEMSTEPNRHRIEDEARARGLKIRTHSGCTTHDFALLAWLQHPDLLEQVHARVVLHQKRTFHYYPVFPDEIPEHRLPAPEDLRNVEETLDLLFSANDQGRKSKILMYPEDEGGEIWFLVRHGGTPARIAGFDLENHDVSHLLRPEEYDVLIYDTRHGFLRINAKKYHDGYRQYFGTLLFGNLLMFREKEVFTLEPLLRADLRVLRGEGVEGIAGIRLVEVKYDRRSAHLTVVTEHSPDLLSDPLFGRAAPEAPLYIHHAIFEVSFVGQSAARKVKITSGNVASYSSDADSTALEAWMRRCGFLRRYGVRKDVAAA
ncbi:MAG: hypothetical protein NTY53_22125 [Kiritimatiellaeota bacterium]|nr:hypothetical protein [Kiritimatiellota bacterium]